MNYNVTYRKKNNGIQAVIQYKDNGKWKQKNKQGFEDSRKGKQAAKEWAIQAINELEKEIKLPKDYKNITFKEYYDSFIKHAKLNLQDNTLRVYRQTFNYLDSIKDIEMKKITSLDIQNCVDYMRQQGLSDGTIVTYIDKLKAIFNNAVENDIIVKNPCKVKISRPKTNKSALTSLQVQELLKKVKDINFRYYIIVAIAVKCGLRRGEIMGLTWSCIHKDYIEVKRQYRRKCDTGEWTFTNLKTENSLRDVPLPPGLYKDLMEYKKIEISRIDGRLFDYTDYEVMNTKLRRLFIKLGYPISMHSLRHTYTTLLIQNGIDLKTVSSLIGDDVGMVMKTYSHVNDEMKERAAELIKGIF